MKTWRKKVCMAAAVGVLFAALTGCAHRPGGIAASNIPLEGRKYRVIGDVSASDGCIWLFGLIPLTGSNTTRSALDKALHSKNADALTNITVESYDEYWILFTRRATQVHGQAIRFE